MSEDKARQKKKKPVALKLWASSSEGAPSQETVGLKTDGRAKDVLSPSSSELPLLGSPQETSLRWNVKHFVEVSQVRIV